MQFPFLIRWIWNWASPFRDLRCNFFLSVYLRHDSFLTLKLTKLSPSSIYFWIFSPWHWEKLKASSGCSLSNSTILSVRMALHSVLAAGPQPLVFSIHDPSQRKHEKKCGVLWKFVFHSSYSTLLHKEAWPVNTMQNNCESLCMFHTKYFWYLNLFVL